MSILIKIITRAEIGEAESAPVEKDKRHLAYELPGSVYGHIPPAVVLGSRVSILTASTDTRGHICVRD